MWRFFRNNRSSVIRKQSAPLHVGIHGAEPPSTEAAPYIVIAQDPNPDELTLVERSLLDYNLEKAGPHSYRKLAALLRDSCGQVLGGITGSTYWGWLMIDVLWVPKELRGKGYGKKLLAAIEDQAYGRGCHHACLDTFTFQDAVGFYERYGYTRLGSLPSFPLGHERIYLFKALTS
jgi:GNAT superfamily N-acetyltransferase